MMGPMVERAGYDPYQILGVERDATPLQVARAHRRLAKRYHPDLHPDPAAAATMQRVNEAWLILSNPGRRADFDRRNPAAGRPPGDHWSGTRQTVNVGRGTAGTGWTAWRAAADTGPAAAAGWRSYPGPRAGDSTSFLRSQRAAAAAEAGPRSFRDSGWAALALAVVFVIFMLLAAGLGAAYWSANNGPLQLQSGDAKD